MTKQLTIRTPDDFHVHLRSGAMLQSVLPYTRDVFGRALVMPNTKPPVLTAEDVTRYRSEIMSPGLFDEGQSFEPLMTIKITEDTTEEIVAAASEVAVAGKLYPAGVTTNSEDGWKDFRMLYPIFRAMEKHDMVLCLHAETPGRFCMDAERDFILRHLADLTSEFPKLRIVVEHVTDAGTLQAVNFWRDKGHPVACTITVHHLFTNLGHVVGSRLQPHNFCMPVPKRPVDQAQLIATAVAAPDYVFLGTDSAPHMRQDKECSSGCAGVFSAPVALPLLAQLFERNGKLENLERFTSENGAKFYGLPLNTGTVTLKKEPWTVPNHHAFDDVVPFWSGREIDWRVTY